MANEKSSSKVPGRKEMHYEVRADRMPPIPLEQMTPAQQKAFSTMRSGPRGAVRGPYWPILRSPGYMAQIQKVGEYFRYGGVLEKRISEMAALITAREW